MLIPTACMLRADCPDVERGFVLLQSVHLNFEGLSTFFSHSLNCESPSHLYYFFFFFFSTHYYVSILKYNQISLKKTNVTNLRTQFKHKYIGVCGKTVSRKVFYTGMAKKKPFKKFYNYVKT